MLQVGGYPSSTNTTNVKTGYVFQNGVKKYLWKNNLCYNNYGDNYWSNFIGVILDKQSNKATYLWMYDGEIHYKSDSFGLWAGSLVSNVRFWSFGNYAFVYLFGQSTLLAYNIVRIDGNDITVMNNSGIPESSTYYRDVICFDEYGIYTNSTGGVYYSEFNKDTLSFGYRSLIPSINRYPKKLFASGGMATLDDSNKILHIVRKGAIVKQYDLSAIYPETNNFAGVIEGKNFIGTFKDENNVYKSRSYNLVTGQVGSDMNVNLYGGATYPTTTIYNVNKLYGFRPGDQTGLKVNSDKSVDALQLTIGATLTPAYFDDNGNIGVFQRKEYPDTYVYTIDGKNVLPLNHPTGSEGVYACHYGSPTVGILFATYNSDGALTKAHISMDNGSNWTTINI